MAFVLGLALMASAEAGDAADAPRGLRLRVELQETSVRYGESVGLLTALENVGSDVAWVRVEAYEHAIELGLGLEIFLVRTDGAVFLPPDYRSPCGWNAEESQSARPLSPGDEIRDDLGVPRVRRASDPANVEPTILLPPGRYRAVCRYRQREREIVGNYLELDSQPMPVPSLWTGTLEATSEPFNVLPAPRIDFTLLLPPFVEPQGPLFARLRVANETSEGIRLDPIVDFAGALLGSPAGRKAQASLLSSESSGASDSPAIPWIGPAAHREYRVDLRALSWTSFHGSDVAGAFTDSFSTPLLPHLLWAQVRVAGIAAPLIAEAVLVIRPDPEVAPETLTLQVLPDPDDPDTLHVSLRNLGCRSIAIPGPLDDPGLLRLEVARLPGTTEEEPASFPPNPCRLDAADPCRGLEWACLAPSDALRCVIDLPSLVGVGLGTESVRVRATWTNHASAEGLGAPTPIGSVATDWIRIDRSRESDGRLRITTRVEPENPREDEPFRLLARYENVSDAAMRVRVVPFAHVGATRGGAIFPWKIREACTGDPTFEPWQVGAAFERYDESHAEIVVLAPREARTYYVDCARVVRTDPPQVPRTQLIRGTLSSGEYVATFESREESLPGVPRELPGLPPLWTGSIRARPARFTVRPSRSPRLLLRPIKTAFPTGPFPIRVIVTNPGAERMSQRGGFELRVETQKGGARARFRLDVPGDLAPGASYALDVPPGGVRAASLDIAGLNLQLDGGGGDPVGIYDFAIQSSVLLTARFVADDGRTLLESDPISVWVAQTSSETDSPIAVEVKLQEDAPSGSTVDVTLRNTGLGPLTVPFPPAYPAEFCFQIWRDPPGTGGAGNIGERYPSRRAGSFAIRPHDLEWEPSAFDTSNLALRERVRTLAPGESVSWPVDLSRLIRGGLPTGAYSVSAIWGNLEGGQRLGFAGRGVHTGMSRSAEIRVRVPEK